MQNANLDLTKDVLYLLSHSSMIYSISIVKSLAEVKQYRVDFKIFPRFFCENRQMEIKPQAGNILI
ncbi:MAG: hypothetical protein K2J30_02305, partial [Clostridia bacterium]|nr:hypothetical protein [Clostridia bacterium]